MYKLEYPSLVLKGTFRMHSVVPLLLPHYAMEHVKVNGFDMSESRLFVHTYSIGQDLRVWDDPDKFIPE